MIKQLFLISSLIWSSSVTFYDSLIPVVYNNIQLELPFVGGFNRPKIQWVDWDLDQDLDLFILDASGYLRYMENQGDVANPDFHLITTFFQNINCKGWFFFYDFDLDGDLELATQNQNNLNNISYYENLNGDLSFTGILADSYGNLVVSSSVMTPTFSDIDNDGDMDFFTGNMVGTLTHYKNIGLLDDNLPVLEYVTDSWQDISIVGGMRDVDRHGASAITFIDIDLDGDLDLSWGDYFQQSLYIIWNIGSSEVPIMNESEITNQYPPKDPIISAGQNMPTFSDLDNDGDNDLFVTVLSGAYGNQLINNFYFYENIGDSVDPIYTYNTSNYFSTLDFFANSSPELVDIDMDGDLDLFIANQYDLSSSPWVGHIYFFRNIGDSANPYYVEETTSLLNEDMGQMLSPEFGDMDGDGDLDLFIGDFNGFIKYYENISTEKELIFNYIENISEIDLSGNSVPSIGDIDGDGDFDLLIGQLNGEVLIYKNTGSSANYNFVLDGELDLQIESNSAPEVIDFDNDGYLDIIIGSGDQGLFFYRNINGDIYDNTIEVDLTIPYIGINSKPSLGYLFNSSLLDVIVGVSNGGLYHVKVNTCVSQGDINDDGGYNVLDIVALANCILEGTCELIANNCVADLNSDGGYNVLDVVALANCILDGNCNQ